jgi:hypothetical protein
MTVRYSVKLIRACLIGLIATILAMGWTSQSTATATSTAPERVQHFSVKGDLSFDHPLAWHEVRYSMTFSFSALITYLSNRKLHDPCTRTNTAGIQETSCGLPIKTLGRDGVLVSWSNIGFPHSGPEIPNPNSSIGGQPAHVEVTTPGNCAQICGDETITAEIARPLGDHYEMVACLRGANSVHNEALVGRMLSTVRVIS